MMEYGICNLAVIPMRAAAGHSSEMISQVLFGEIFEIIERQDKWLKIITALDDYEGWIHELQFSSISQEVFIELLEKRNIQTSSIITAAQKLGEQAPVLLPFGSTLPFLHQGMCTTGSELFEIDMQEGIDGFLAIAYSFLNTPYLWGGRTHFGIDCSGFSQAVLRTQGVALYRDARLQAEQGETVDFLPEAKTGDLAFFDNEEGHITHVGIMLGNSLIIHASGKVKIEQIDDEGIYSADLKRHTHRLRIVKTHHLNL